MELEKKIKNKRTTRIVMIIVAVLIVTAILFAIFFPRSKGGTHNGTVTIEIRCDQLTADMSKLNVETLAQYIPEDGMILKATKWPIVKKETTVFDVLTEACLENNIQLEYNSTPVYGGSYIEGINYLYEFSAGKYSGWMYLVDGEAPSYSADKIKLNGGETITWYYSVDYRLEGM